MQCGVPQGFILRSLLFNWSDHAHFDNASYHSYPMNFDTNNHPVLFFSAASTPNFLNAIELYISSFFC